MRRDDQRLVDIPDALDWIARAIAGKAEEDFLADETLCYAVAQRQAVDPIALRQAAGDDLGINVNDIPRLTDRQLAAMVRLRL